VGKGVTHPHVLAVLQRLVLVPRGGDPVEPELTQQRQEDLFDQLVFAATVEGERSTRRGSG